MNSEKKYRKIENELDSIVRAELNSRISGTQKKQDISKACDILELKNRQIVEAHTKGKTESILQTLFSGYLQTREGGSLYFASKTGDKKLYLGYINKKDRFETLFTASMMALADRDLADIINKKRSIFHADYDRQKDILRLIKTVYEIKKQADMSIAENPGIEENAVSYLTELAPLRSDLKLIEARCVEFQTWEYIQEAVRQLRHAIQSADASISQKGRKAARFLFDKAGTIYHSYKSTQADISCIEMFMNQKEELERYADIFDSTGDDNRRDRIRGFIAGIESTLGRLQSEIETQKDREARISEKHRQDIKDAYDRFVEIREMYANGQLETPNQQKNAGLKLKKCRDRLIAGGQRVMARDIERFMNTAGIGRTESAAGKKETGEIDNFDYKRGFMVLLAVTIILVLIIFLLITFGKK